MGDRRGRRLLLGAAAVGSVLGLAFIVEPGLAPELPIGYALLVFLAFGATVVGLRLLRARRQIDMAFFDPPAPEYTAIVEVSGRAFDADLSGQKSRVRDRLRATTATFLERIAGYDRTEAEEAIDDGSWTDDTAAAAFFSKEVPQDLGSVVVGSESRHVISQAIAVIAVLADRIGYDAPTDIEADREEVTTFPPHRATESDATEHLIPAPGEATTRETKRWRGLGVFVLLAAVIGIIATQPSLLLVAGVGGGVAVYVGFWRSNPISNVDLEVERTLSPDDPKHGEEVTVTVTIRNDGDRLLPDVRFVDGVPAGLRVTGGSPRCGALLRSGERTSFTYSLEAGYGEHAFQDPIVIVRDVCGELERIVRPSDISADTIDCDLEEPSRTRRTSIESRARDRPGTASAEMGGRGVEFYTTREYRQGDPPSLVDWHRLARTGELATIEFNRQRASTALFVIDARRPAHVAPTYRSPSAVDRSRVATAVAMRSLKETVDRVGFMALSHKRCRLPIGGGKWHQYEADEILKSHPALTKVPGERERTDVWSTVRRIRHHARSNPRIILFSPLVDDFVNRLAGRLLSLGYPLTVVSPDPTGLSTVGETLSKVERDLRIAALRARAVHVVDWAEDEALAAVLRRSSTEATLAEGRR